MTQATPPANPAEPTTQNTTSTTTTEAPIPNDTFLAEDLGDGESDPTNSDPTTTQNTTAKAEVPDSYTFTAVEGRTLDQSAIESITPIFKELGLDQAAVDKLNGWYGQQLDRFHQSTVDMVSQLRKEWRDSVMADPIIGKNFRSTRIEIGKAMAVLEPEVSSSLKEALNFTGAGDHPAVIRALFEFSKLINEGKPSSPGNGPSPAGQRSNMPTAAQAIYPNLTKPAS